MWRRRHGGALPSLFPFAASAQRGLDELLPQMQRFLAHARLLASALRQVPGIVVVPDPPQTPLFHVHLRGDSKALEERALDVAQERGVWLFHRLAPSVVRTSACSSLRSENRRSRSRRRRRRYCFRSLRAPRPLLSQSAGRTADSSRVGEDGRRRDFCVAAVAGAWVVGLCGLALAPGVAQAQSSVVYAVNFASNDVRSSASAPAERCHPGEP